MLVGISGLAGSGKDTVGNILAREHGFVTMAFADPIKRICAELYGWDDETCWGGSELRNKPDPRYVRTMIPHPGEAPAGLETIPVYLTPRYAMQTLGTEWARNCYEATWVDYGLRVAKQLLDSPTRLGYTRSKGIEDTSNSPFTTHGVAITDVRFRNELDAIQLAGGLVIRVKRPGSGLGGAAGIHQSEAEQASIGDWQFDYVIDNDGDLVQLATQVREAMHTLTEGQTQRVDF